MKELEAYPLRSFNKLRGIRLRASLRYTLRRARSGSRMLVVLIEALTTDYCLPITDH
jgi:hypothetical protein